MPSNPGWGALFSNKKKEAGSKQPDYQGEAACCHCEKPLRLAGWKRTTDKGLTYLNLKLEPEREGERPEKKREDDDGSCPF